jgi:hypothetical protein
MVYIERKHKKGKEGRGEGTESHATTQAKILIFGR